MENYQNIYLMILLGAQFIAALIGITHLKSVKGTIWAYFVYFLIFIFLQELYFEFYTHILYLDRTQYFTYVSIPIQFLFYYWLFAYHSLNQKKLFYLFASICILTIPLEYMLKDAGISFLNYTIGTLLLFLLIVLEFLKQIKSEEILYFQKNKMFYILVGVLFFFIGTYPFFAFHAEFKLHYPSIWNMYYIYFIVANVFMYLLFAASFIWGKRHS